MPQSKLITFTRTVEPISGLVTKFGGQPNWLEEPQWPISTELEEPMRFICQIDLADVDSRLAGKMAYIFMTEDEEDYVDGTFDPEGGENAVVIQPGGVVRMETRPIHTGPTLQIRNESGDGFDSVEFSVAFTEKEEPEFAPEAQRAMNQELTPDIFEKLQGSKIGGTPGFIQGDEFPEREGKWTLLAQIDSADIPFPLNLGDAGIAYSYLNAEASEGAFLWQCC